MRRTRITYKGVYHHVINRKIMGADIFLGNKAMYHFLEYMKEKYMKLKIRIFGYCQDDKHRPQILQKEY